MARYKRCTKCGMVKKRTELYLHRTVGRNPRLGSYCKACSNKIRVTYPDRRNMVNRTRYEVLDYFSQPLED